MDETIKAPSRRVLGERISNHHVGGGSLGFQLAIHFIALGCRDLLD